jgi:REP element-mobilizing transposase RayT
VPEYRKRILGDEVSQHWRDIFLRVAEEYEFWIYTTYYQTHGDNSSQLRMLEELSDTPPLIEG